MENHIKMQAKEIINRYNLDKHSWVCKSLHSVLHTMFPATINLLNPLKEYYGDSFKLFVFFIIDDYLYWYYNAEDMTRLRESFAAKIMRDTGFVTKFEAEWRAYVKIFMEKCEIVDKSNLKNLDDKELLGLYEELYAAYVKEYSLAMGLIESFSMQMDGFFRPIIENIVNEKNSIKVNDNPQVNNRLTNKTETNEKYDLNAVYSLLLSPIDLSFINKELKERLEIIKSIKYGLEEEKINELLKSHSKKYFWIENNYAIVKYLDEEYFRAKITKQIEQGVYADKDINEIKNKITDIRIRKAEIIKELNLSEEIQNIIKATERFAIMQDDRKKCVLISNHYQKLFLEEIGRRVELSLEEMNCTISPELHDLLLAKEFANKKEDYKQILARRKKASLVIETLSQNSAATGFEVFDNEIALAVFNQCFNKTDAAKEIKGTCASPGKATGNVKLIMKTEDIAKVPKDAIVVTSMTRPDMISAIARAKAIITDEGGVTCHAAIISRERSIPCIIATKNATKALKDGDMVEVDADKGTVRILH